MRSRACVCVLGKFYAKKKCRRTKTPPNLLRKAGSEKSRHVKKIQKEKESHQHNCFSPCFSTWRARSEKSRHALPSARAIGADLVLFYLFLARASRPPLPPPSLLPLSLPPLLPLPLRLVRLSVRTRCSYGAGKILRLLCSAQGATDKTRMHTRTHTHKRTSTQTQKDTNTQTHMPHAHKHKCTQAHKHSCTQAQPGRGTLACTHTQTDAQSVGHSRCEQTQHPQPQTPNPKP